MNITVCGIEQASALLTTVKFSHIVSINNPGQSAPVIPKHQGEVLRLRFDDIEVPYGASITTGYVPVSVPQMESLCWFLEWFKLYNDNNKDGRILIHCSAGIARSTAAALVLLYMETVEAQIVVDELLKLAPDASPNRRMCRLADDLLNAEGCIVDCCERVHEYQKVRGR